MTNRNHAWTLESEGIETCRNGCGCMRSIGNGTVTYARPDGLGGIVRSETPPRCEVRGEGEQQ